MTPDDVTRFIHTYTKNRLIETDPFMTLDERGVGALIASAIKRAKAANPRLRISATAAVHTSETASVKLLHTLGVHAISCPVNRVPLARIAAAQANIESSYTSTSSSIFSVPGAVASGLLNNPRVFA